MVKKEPRMATLVALDRTFVLLFHKPGSLTGCTAKPFFHLIVRFSISERHWGTCNYIVPSVTVHLRCANRVSHGVVSDGVSVRREKGLRWRNYQKRLRSDAMRVKLDH